MFKKKVQRFLKWLIKKITHEISEKLKKETKSLLISKVKLATVAEGDPKAPFSIATTPRGRGGRYSFPCIAPLYPWSLPYNAEC